jgi:hypothetical protein
LYEEAINPFRDLLKPVNPNTAIVTFLYNFISPNPIILQEGTVFQAYS